jgi:probable phosphoglycerate mutase
MADRLQGWPDTCCGWLLRHGMTEGNARGLVQGQGAGTGLSAAGRGQVEAAAAAVLGAPVRPVSIVSSDLERCRQTAAVLAEALELPVRYDADLRERSFGVLEGRLWADVPPDAVGIRDGVVTGPASRPRDGESVADLASRVSRALRRTARYPGPVLIVTHGGPIRVAAGLRQGRFHGWPPVPHARPVPFCLGQLAAEEAALA